MTERQVSTEALRQTLVQLLMAAIGAPDDEEIARAATGAVREPALPTAWEPSTAA
ncbi:MULTISPECIES: hypothetical protein [unclassified Streptomyces]|jgi:hypothetical protein|uniref:hypothetical protein n=1 Tax=unclassified Streptomyces TaxID=2593676 RepID=UPI00380C0619